MLIYKSKHLDIWKTEYREWKVWLVPREFVVFALGAYRVGICWRPSVYGGK